MREDSTQPLPEYADTASALEAPRFITGGANAADWAAAQVTRVRDDPSARIALLLSTYRGPPDRSPGHLPFRRAAMSFMRWQIRRGLLNDPTGTPPGSRWWRAVNDRLLLDGCEAMASYAGLPGSASSPTIELWLWFIAEPTGRNWYRAHNASIVCAYLDNVALAELESATERFFLNVSLVRVLYAHALNASPRLALGRFAPLGRLLGDPRLGMTGAFLSLGRALPDRYPLLDDLSTYRKNERGLGPLLDYGAIAPRLHALYDWSAGELGIPGLRGLVRDGCPIYAWPHADRHPWRPLRDSTLLRLMRLATAPR